MKPKLKFKVGQRVWAYGVIAKSYGQFCNESAIVRFTDEEDSDSAFCAQAAEIYHKDLKKVSKRERGAAQTQEKP